MIKFVDGFEPSFRLHQVELKRFAQKCDSRLAEHRLTLRAARINSFTTNLLRMISNAMGFHLLVSEGTSRHRSPGFDVSDNFFFQRYLDKLILSVSVHS